MNSHGQSRILILSNHFITLYQFRRELIEELLGQGYEVLLSLPPSADNVFFRERGCRVIESPIDRRGINPLKDVRLLWHYVRLIARCRPVAVLSFTIKPNIYGAIACNRLGVPQICNVTGTGATFLKRGLLRSLAMHLYRLSVRGATCVFFQNEGDRQFFRTHGMVNGNDHRIPGSGVNLEQYALAEFPASEAVRFLFAGRIMRLKGVDELLAAAAALAKTHAKVEVVLAGFIEEPEYEIRLRDLVQEGVVHYLGFEKDMVTAIRNAHCIILPSHGGEGIPNVLLEAAAMGRPAIVSAIPGSVEAVQDGVNGFHFEAGNAGDLLDKMQRFLSLTAAQRELMGQEGRRLVETQFDRKYIIYIYMKTINAILQSNPLS
ncbi:MAG: glycosyltransferase family 4 protein [Puniceicoccaceae bacterium]